MKRDTSILPSKPSFRPPSLTGTVSRVLLLIGYSLLSFVVALISVRSDGYGSQIPTAITFSWGILPSEFGLVSIVTGFWVMPVTYLLCLFALTSVCAQSERLTVSLAPIVFHGLGIGAALLNVKPGEPVTPINLTASVVLAGAYLCGDWWLAGRNRPTNSRHIKTGIQIMFPVIFSFCTLSSGCTSTKPDASPAHNPTLIAMKALADRYGWRKQEVEYVQELNDSWIVMVWMLPKTPGGHMVVEISKESGAVIGLVPGS